MAYSLPFSIAKDTFKNLISSPYGFRLHPVRRIPSFHYGIDLKAPQGTPITSIGDGIVIHAGYNDKNGNYVAIRHANNEESWYLHLLSYNVRTEQKISEGQIIGYVGSTGTSTGPHLHLGIKSLGVWINPLNALGFGAVGLFNVLFIGGTVSLLSYWLYKMFRVKK